VNRDIRTRDEILFGNYDPKAYTGGTRRFARVDVDTLQELVELDFVDVYECQNDSPTIREFLDFVEYSDERGSYRFDGYAVIDTRNDYSVSIDCISKIKPFGQTSEIVDFAELVATADDFYLSSRANDRGEYGYAWWD
jgi:hypothetical protein